MIKSIITSNTDICADCSSPDPSWVSINRGVLICDGCCSIHLSLGRHISQVKSLKKGSWNPYQLIMVQQLINSGANNIWESSLHEVTLNKANKKKPSFKDPIHPTRAEFIRAKYQFLAFMNKSKDNESYISDELNKQLHAIVRTSNLESALRLLALGADPNSIHPEKRNTSLHVAALSNQICQVELLLVYGADPGIFDHMGKIPLDLARNNGHNELAERLVECQYELIDGLAFYLCARKPDHKSGQHFLIPEVSDGLDISEMAKAAKKKLQVLSNNLFEELIMDVYDEVDRRENETNWLILQEHNTTLLTSERQIVPFLPANPEFSATRNQGRQKLAKFNKREFATLIIDILNDAKRRYAGVISFESNTKSIIGTEKEFIIPSKSNVSNLSLHVDPIYDQVYFDEDYASIPENSMNQINGGEKNVTNDESYVSMIEYLSLKKMLADSQLEIQSLTIELTKSQENSKKLFDEVSMLNTKLEKMFQENHLLRSFSNKDEATFNCLETLYSFNEIQNPRWTVLDRNDYQKHMTKNIDYNKDYALELFTDSKSNDLDEITKICNNFTMDNKLAEPNDICNDSYTLNMIDCQPKMPTQDEVVKKTEKITRALQELFQSAQDNKIDYFSICADKIHAAVSEMTLIFPTSLTTGTQLEALQLLNDGAEKVKEQCYHLPMDVKFHTQRVIQTAYDIAKAAKQLVMTFE